MIRAINIKTALLKTVKPYLDTKALGIVGGSLINSTILYGAPVWGHTTQKNIELIQKYQTKAARMILKGGWQNEKLTHRQEALDTLGWPNVEQIVISSTLNLTKAAIDQESSRGLNNIFKVTHPTNCRKGQGTRIENKAHASTQNKSFSSHTPQLFNQLPPHMRQQLISRKKFKTELKLHIQMNHKLPHH